MRQARPEADGRRVPVSVCIAAARPAVDGHEDDGRVVTPVAVGPVPAPADHPRGHEPHDIALLPGLVLQRQHSFRDGRLHPRRVSLLHARSAVVLADRVYAVGRCDVVGGEVRLGVGRLVAEPALLCKISYLFVEFHHLPKQRANLTRWGLDEDLYEIVKNRIHALMEERPGCKLQVYWRSFWAACGDRQRFEWLNAPQVTDREADGPGGILGGGRPRGRAAKRGRRRRGRE